MRTCLFCEQELDKDNPSPFCDDVCRLRAAEVKGFYDVQTLSHINGGSTMVHGRFPRKRSATFHRHH